ncbi:23267_t:CDS:2 [Cetraspora pellucida]|uniref:23267_t:CDS:1 n=1 Tax=Cetraspora pellucida TaxID=1433469 RepID=A0A9N9NGS2_9GLOM|nr:23267_t:CDS:2 [Cetraspora pellucida]
MVVSHNHHWIDKFSAIIRINIKKHSSNSINVYKRIIDQTGYIEYQVFGPDEPNPARFNVNQ